MPFRHDDAKGPGMGAIVQRRMHEPDLAVERYKQPARLGADLSVAEMKPVQVAFLGHPPEAPAAPQGEEPERAARLHHVDPELPRVEPVAAAEGKELHAVFVVADEHAWRAVGPGEVFCREAQAPA